MISGTRAATPAVMVRSTSVREVCLNDSVGRRTGVKTTIRVLAVAHLCFDSITAWTGQQNASWSLPPQAAMGKELEQRSADAGREPGGTAGAIAARGGDPAIAAFIGGGNSGLNGSTPAELPGQEPSTSAQDGESSTALGSDANEPASTAEGEAPTAAQGTGAASVCWLLRLHACR